MNKFFNWPTNPLRFLRFDTARAEEVNAAFDELSAGMDDLNDDVNRSFKLPPGSPDQLINLAPGQRAGLRLGFDAAGNITAVSTGKYRGDWVTGTSYLVGDNFRDPGTGNIYSVVEAHTAGVLTDDIIAGLSQMSINVSDVTIAKNAAQSAAIAAGLSEVAAFASEQAAFSSQGAAATSESNASTSASNASGFELAAAGHASDANDSRVAAQTSESNAAASELKAYKWAQQAEDVPVETGLFSAYHWALKSEEFAIAASGGANWLTLPGKPAFIGAGSTADLARAEINAAADSAVTTSVDGLMVAADKTKLDGVATNANNYTHPTNHPPSVIAQDAGNRFVTDAEKLAWSAPPTAAEIVAPIHAATTKAPLADADEFGVSDSAGSWALVKTTWATIKANMKMWLQNQAMTWTGLQIFKAFRETVVTASTSTAYTVNNANGTLFILTLTGNCTYTFPAATAGGQFTIIQNQDATGSRTVAWPASVRWPDGTAPTITATASKSDVIAFVADGTYWLGFVGGLKYTRA